MDLSYRQFPPPSDLADAVSCVWFMKGASAGGEAGAQRILPDGCVELVFNLADPFRDLTRGDSLRQPNELLVGPTTRHMLIQPPGEIDLAAIRLRPGGAPALLPAPQEEIRDAWARISDCGLPSAARLRARLARDGTPGERYRSIVEFLRQAIRLDKLDPRVIQACRTISRRSGDVGIEDLAKRLGLSRRSVERLFRIHLGLRPKLCARLARFQSVLRSTAPGDASGLRDAALDAGYFDQAHFLKDFRAFAGQSPTEFFRLSDNAMSSAFASPRG